MQLRVQLKELEDKLQKVNDEIAAWAEFKNAEGRPYFYNSKTMESTWDKPIVFSDLIGKEMSLKYLSFEENFFIEDVQNQLEMVNKSIHDSERELKRLQNEQSQMAAATAANEKANAAAAAAAAAVPVPGSSAFLNGITLEKLDQNDIRRFVS